MTRKKDNLKVLDDLVNKIKKDPQVLMLPELLTSSIDAYKGGKPLKKKQELKK
jgi:hypothetical protein